MIRIFPLVAILAFLGGQSFAADDPDGLLAVCDK